MSQYGNNSQVGQRTGTKNKSGYSSAGKICWRPSGMIVFKCKSGKLLFPFQALHFGFTSCSRQSPFTEILEA